MILTNILICAQFLICTNLLAQISAPQYLNLKVDSIENASFDIGKKVFDIEIKNTSENTVFIEPFSEVVLKAKIANGIDTNVTATLIIPDLDSALGEIQSYGLRCPGVGTPYTVDEDNFLLTKHQNNGYQIGPQKVKKIKIIIDMDDNFLHVNRGKIKNGVKLALRINYYEGEKHFYNVELISDNFYNLNDLFDYHVFK